MQKYKLRDGSLVTRMLHYFFYAAKLAL